MKNQTADQTALQAAHQTAQWPQISLCSRVRFVAQVRQSVIEARPFAAGKLGVSEKQWLYYPLHLADEADPRRRAAFFANLRHHALSQSGIFPMEQSYLLRFVDFYLEHLRNLDSVGLFRHPIERELIARHQLLVNFIDYEHQEPDRSIPAHEENCYLPAFRDKRVLIISPFASTMVENARQDRFEAVWAKTGKSWFFPKSVISLELPYGVAPETRKRYQSTNELFDELCEKISRIDFDVALIGAAGLNIPLVSHLKQQGKVAIALGGHLQVVFGVLGKRWRDRKDWVENYVTDAWIPVPDRYHLQDKFACDQGAYW